MPNRFTDDASPSFDFEPIGRAGMLLLLLAAIERLDHLNGEVVALRLVLEGARDRLAWFDQDAVDPDAGGAVT